MVRVPAAGLFIPMQGPSNRPHASLNQDRGHGQNGAGELLSREPISPSTVPDEFSIVHGPPLLVVHQLWNEVTEASAGFQESEALPAEA